MICGNTAGPLADIEGLEPMAQNGSPVAGPSGSRSSNLPPLTPEDRNKFMKIFMKSNPSNGALEGTFSSNPDCVLVLIKPIQVLVLARFL